MSRSLKKKKKKFTFYIWNVISMDHLGAEVLPKVSSTAALVTGRSPTVVEVRAELVS